MYAVAIASGSDRAATIELGDELFIATGNMQQHASSVAVEVATSRGKTIRSWSSTPAVALQGSWPAFPVQPDIAHGATRGDGLIVEGSPGSSILPRANGVFAAAAQQQSPAGGSYRRGQPPSGVQRGGSETETETDTEITVDLITGEQQLRVPSRHKRPKHAPSIDMVEPQGTVVVQEKSPLVMPQHFSIFDPAPDLPLRRRRQMPTVFTWVTPLFLPPRAFSPSVKPARPGPPARPLAQALPSHLLIARRSLLCGILTFHTDSTAMFRSDSLWWFLLALGRLCRRGCFTFA